LIVQLNAATGERRPEPFLDLRPRLASLKQGFDERGLLGIALHPKFEENRKVYLYYSAPLRAGGPARYDHTSHLSEFQVAPDLSRILPDSERLLLQIDEPYFNHNGGRLAFGPDGLLYAGIGDGGNAHDQGFDRPPTGNAQNLTTLLGKILRIDVDGRSGSLPYAIPADNPLTRMSGARPEIYAWGIRNPWGMSFDRAGDRALIAADVGQGRYEEVNLIVKGGNYGWNLREGFHAFDPKNPTQTRVDPAMDAADKDALREPILEYKNLNAFPQDPDALGLSVTGGYIYRGQDLPHLQGKYVFGDWSRQWAAPDGRLFVASPPASGDAGARWELAPLPVASHPDHRIGGYVVGFGEDARGELYVLTTQRAGLVDRTGIVWKLEPTAATRK
jgi:glucose/arabinose dehydrogenase